MANPSAGVHEPTSNLLDRPGEGALATERAPSPRHFASPPARPCATGAEPLPQGFQPTSLHLREPTLASPSTPGEGDSPRLARRLLIKWMSIREHGVPTRSGPPFPRPGWLPLPSHILCEEPARALSFSASHLSASHLITSPIGPSWRGASERGAATARPRPTGTMRPRWGGGRWGLEGPSRDEQAHPRECP